MIVELAKQNTIQNSELLTVTKQYSLSKNISLHENQKNWLAYNKLIEEFREFVYLKIIFPKDKFLKLSKNERVEILNRLSKIIENIIMSQVVYSNSQYLNEWNIFFTFDFTIFKMSMTHYTLNDSINITYEGKLITSGEEYLNKAFNRFQKKFQELEDKFGEYQLDWMKKYLK
jgi:hypothetical protein